MFVMSEDEIKQALTRYHFLVAMLNIINDKTDEALKNNNNWFAFAPKICGKFIKQAFTLELLFSEKILELRDQTTKPFEDLSAIYATLRMQFETHALFYHLFIPCKSMEENILRFRLWELDGIRGKIKFNTNRSPNLTAQTIANKQYLPVIEQAIFGLPYYKQLDAKVQKFLLDNAAWRFTNDSLKIKPLRRITYEQLIMQTGIKETIYADLYAYFSMHSHPNYVGVIQSYSSTDEEIIQGRYVGIMYASFVTAFMIEDIAKRFTQGKAYLDNLTPFDKNVYESVRSGGRKV